MVVVAACHEAHSSAGADQLQQTGSESGGELLRGGKYLILNINIIRYMIFQIK